MRVSAGGHLPQHGPTPSFETAGITQGSGPTLWLLRGENLGAATQRRPAAVPAYARAGDGASHPAQPRLRCRGSPWSSPGAACPAHPGPAPRPPACLTMAAARAGPAPPGLRPSDPRLKLRADLAATPSPARLPECGPLGTGPAAGEERTGLGAGPAPQRLGVPARAGPGCPPGGRPHNP
uniref:atherin-like n=1 Tax=Callithrix jacchus TaxID=9483 RepID=UPI0023DD2E3F|nr:atherin-like [Callithrix jacchus]